MSDLEFAEAVDGLPTAEDLVLIGEGCSLACKFCIYRRGRAGVSLAEALDEHFKVPVASRVTILAGDVLRLELAPLIRRLVAVGAVEVISYCHPGTSEAPLTELKSAGLTGLYLMLPAASARPLAALTGGLSTLSRVARLLDRANALGLSVAIEVPVTPSSWHLARATVRAALHRVAMPDRVVLRFLSEFDPRRGRVRLDPEVVKTAIEAAIAVARDQRVPVHLAHPQAPPPCVLNLESATGAMYPGFMIAGWSRSRPHPMEACKACSVATVCPATDEHLDLASARPIKRPARTLDGASSVTLFIRQDDLGRLLEELRGRPVRPCRYPWEELEAHDIRGMVTPCAGGWPRPEAVARCESFRSSSLLTAWNSVGMQEFRRAVASGRPMDTCKPECPAFHGGPQTAIPPIPAPVSRTFHDNLVLNLREMLDGALILSSKPLTISFSPTLRCPNRCRMCDVHEVRQVMGDGPELRDMTDALKDELIALLPTTRMLALTGGEPLASRRMIEVLRAFDAEKYPDGAVTITTNGLLLRESLLKDLRGTRFKAFYVSLNAATEETYEFVSGTRGGFKKVLQNLELLLRYASTMVGRPRVVLSFVVMRSTWRELPAFLDLSSRLNCHVRLLPIERDQNSESIFTHHDELVRVLELLDREIAPRLASLPWSYGSEVRRLRSILHSKLARRDFTPL